MRTTKTLAVMVMAVIVPACGGSSSSGPSGPPPATLTALAVGATGTDTLATAGQVNYWSFAATAGQVLNVELWANRFDQAAWNAAGNRAVVQLLGTDQSTILASSAASFASDDAEISYFRIPVNGTYFLKVAATSASNAGGGYAVRVSSPTITNPQTEVEVGAGGTNDTPATAEAITPGTVFGTKQGVEVDCYSFSTAGAARVTVQLRMRQSGQAKDGSVDLLNSTGATVYASFDDGIGADSYGSFALLAAGTYVIRVTESGIATASVEPYSLTLTVESSVAVSETETNDTIGSANNRNFGETTVGALASSSDVDVFSCTGGLAGDLVRVWYYSSGNLESGTLNMNVELIGSDGTTLLPQATQSTGFLRNVRTLFRTTGIFFIRLTSVGGSSGSYYFFLERVQQSTYETVANDSIAQAQALGTGGAGVINPAGDVDVYSFAGVAGQIVTLTLSAGPGVGDIEPDELKGYGSTLAPKLTIRDGLGAVLATSSESLPNPIGTILPLGTIEVAFVAPATGTFYVTVADNGGAGAATAFYLLSVR